MSSDLLLLVATIRSGIFTLYPLSHTPIELRLSLRLKRSDHCAHVLPRVTELQACWRLYVHGQFAMYTLLCSVGPVCP